MKRAVISVLLLAMAGCTTTSTMRLAADQAIITTRGNAFTSADAVQKDLLLQAASQTVAAGFEWFEVVRSRDVTTRGSLTMPAEGDYNASGNASGFTATGSYRGADRIDYTKPGLQVAVHFGRAGALVAAEVIALNPKRH